MPGHKLVLICLLFCTCAYHVDEARRAVITVPIADLFSHCPSSDEVQAGLLNPALSGEHGGCIRTAQALFNEQVDVLDRIPCTSGLVQVQLYTSFYITAPFSQFKQSFFWAEPKDLVFLDQITQKVGAHVFPEQYSFTDPASIKNVTSDHVATLRLPWFEPITGRLFSVGTRFARLDPENKSESPQPYAVVLFDPKTETAYHTHIPKKLCMPDVDNFTEAQRRKLFVELIRDWLSFGAGIVPYVWGGSSFTAPMDSGPFEQWKTFVAQKSVTYWVRRSAQNGAAPIKPPFGVFSGFDCIGLIRLAAQLCEIPLFYKTTSTLAQAAAPLQANTQPQVGDIIWLPGHVMIISQVNDPALIEAVGYSSGFGKTQEMVLPQRLSQIKNYEELMNVINQNTPITLINQAGRPLTQAKMRIYSLIPRTEYQTQA